RSSDQDGSAACDYQECMYTCSRPDATVMDASSFRVLFSSQRIEQVISYIRDTVFTTESSIPIEKLYYDLNDTSSNHYVILRAIQTMIEARIVIHNRFGVPCYVCTDGNTLF